MRKIYFVYIITNKNNSVLYTGVTNNLNRRIYEHKNKLVAGFTSSYNVCKLIWFEEFARPDEAIEVEKKIKGWTRAKKIILIKNQNPTFRDLML